MTGHDRHRSPAMNNACTSEVRSFLTVFYRDSFPVLRAFSASGVRSCRCSCALAPCLICCTCFVWGFLGPHTEWGETGERQKEDETGERREGNGGRERGEAERELVFAIL